MSDEKAQSTETLGEFLRELKAGARQDAIMYILTCAGYAGKAMGEKALSRPELYPAELRERMPDEKAVAREVVKMFITSLQVLGVTRSEIAEATLAQVFGMAPWDIHAAMREAQKEAEGDRNAG